GRGRTDRLRGRTLPLPADLVARAPERPVRARPPVRARRCALRGDPLARIDPLRDAGILARCFPAAGVDPGAPRGAGDRGPAVARIRGRRLVPRQRRGSLRAPAVSRAALLHRSRRDAVLRRNPLRERPARGGAAARRLRQLAAARRFRRTAGRYRRRMERPRALSARRRGGRDLPRAAGRGMTDPLLRAALLGTGRESALPADARLEALLPAVPLTAERRLLLLAGVDAVRRRAGYRPAQRARSPEAAPDETRPACSKAVGRLLADFLAAGNEELLGETAELLERTGQRLRPELLPTVLAIPDEALREAFLPVLGKRGPWLSQFHPAWSWARPEDTGPLDPAEARRLWTEGTFPERFSLMERLRAREPAAARDLLASSWKEEKAEHRAELIDAMAEGLGAGDEAFLESVLDDRSAQVRASAAPLLAWI